MFLFFHLLKFERLHLLLQNQTRIKVFYFLCKAISFGEKNMTNEEMSKFRLSTLKLRYENALQEYEISTAFQMGRLIAKRELPVLQRASVLLKLFREK